MVNVKIHRRMVEWTEDGRERAVLVFTQEDLRRLVTSLEFKGIRHYLVRIDA